MSPTRLAPAERRRLAPLGAALARAARPGPPRLETVAGALPRLPGGRAGLLAGTFNPLTRAHAALAVAARHTGCDRVLLAMALVSLDKERVRRAHPVDRLDWVVRWARRRRWATVAVASHPLLVDMAEPLAAATGARVALVVGADKAVQLVDPRYYDDPAAALDRLAATARLLVAPRAGHEVPELPLPADPLPTPGWVPARSATQVRALAAAGADLTGLVPAELVAPIRRTGAYDEGRACYLARARELDALTAPS